MLLLHPRTTILKYITGNISFLAELDSMESPRLPGLAPDGTYTSFHNSPAHTHQAKGYPDLASRVFLGQVAEQAPHIPIFALVDLDPDGIAILSTYKYGSYRLAHEKVTPQDTPGLSLPNMQWLGVKRHHISRTPVGESNTDTNVVPALQGIMKLTARDRTKAMRMLDWDLCREDGPEQDWRHELQTMLMLNTKAEMQILDELPGGLVSWLGSELDTACAQRLELSTDRPCSDDGMLF
jgi:meiotic recombination protein SPO11